MRTSLSRFQVKRYIQKMSNHSGNISQRPHQNCPGYTLVEILLVVLIIGILSAAGFSTMLDIQTTATANNINSQMQNIVHRARSLALSGRQVTSCTQNPADYGIKKTVARNYGVEFRIADNEAILFADRFNSVSDVGFDDPDDIPEGSTDCPDKILDRISFSPAFSLSWVTDGVKYEDDMTLSYTYPFADFSMLPFLPEAVQNTKFTMNICKGTCGPVNGDLTDNSIRNFIFYANTGIPQ